MKKTCLTLFSVFFALAVILLAGCTGGSGNDFEVVVRDGYFGEYADITVSEILDFNYGALFDNKEWDSGTTDDGKKIVQVKYYNDGDNDSLTIQFTLKSNNIFKITGYVDTTEKQTTSSDIMAALNKSYLTVFLSKNKITPNSAEETNLINRLSSISASAVLFGADKSYEGDRGEICRIFGESPIELSVTELLDSYGIIDMSLYDFAELPNQSQPEAGDAFSQNNTNNGGNTYEAYDSILEKYRTALSEHWTIDQLTNENMNYMLAFENNISEVGYAYKDIDNNGVDELIIGYTGGGSDGSFLDLYTLAGGHPSLIASSGEHDTYCICSNGLIMLDGSYSAFESYYDFYVFINDSLTFIEELYYDDEMGTSSDPWQYTSDGQTYIHVSEDYVSQVLDAYQKTAVVYTPLSK